ncbi:hypothetical protein LOC71_18975 [Rhodopirellula sp. JC740]|uniref:Uncharacterized protein n=1 Tax=Rhodopirellula halodulae TaxID=2894198 RepID=A0ABS8NPH8_9BACT|nr:hypothetical protein [Rhodopirellula sp. JC740]MCC9644366.1 hypothetical protein [Rhodopirellula sp. JC740]
MASIETIDRFYISDRFARKTFQAEQVTCDNAKAMERIRVATSSARDMNTIGHAAPKSIPPKEHSAVYMIALTVRFAEKVF